MSAATGTVTLLVYVTPSELDAAVGEGGIRWVTGHAENGTEVTFWVSGELPPQDGGDGYWLDVPLGSLRGGV